MERTLVMRRQHDRRAAAANGEGKRNEDGSRRRRGQQERHAEARAQVRVSRRKPTTPFT